MDNQNNVKIFVFVIVILILGTIATVVARSTSFGNSVTTSLFGTSIGGSSSGLNYDAFATCLKDQGAKFYGAFWCPHCQAQKKMFGSSVKLLPYVECSTADATGQTPICIEKGVKSYPTWEFADGSRLTGEIPLTQLAEKTSCVLPGTLPAPTPLPPVNTGAASPAK